MANETNCKDIFNNALNLQKISKDLEAEKLYEIILQRQNCNFKTKSLNNLGIIYKKRGLLDKAKRFFIDATLENTKFWEGYLNLGDCFFDAENYEYAVNCYKKAILIKKDSSRVNLHLANALNHLGEIKESKKFYSRISLKDEYYYFNLANLNFKSGYFNSAKYLYKKSIKLNNKFFDAHYSLSRIEFLLKNYSKFQNYFWFRNLRYEIKKNPANNLNIHNVQIKKFHKNELKNKKIVFFLEQGIGDEVFFASMLEIFKQKFNAELSVVVSDRLKNIFNHSFKNIGIYSIKDIKKNDFKFHIKLPFGAILEYLSFPKDLENKKKSFLIPNTELDAFWNKELKSKYELNIGISWQGGSKRYQKENRSFNPQELINKFPANINIVNLQPNSEIQFSKLKSCKNQKLSNFNNIKPLKELDNYFALINNLDYVFTCDNSVAHFAGSLGVKTFLFLPTIPDYRWLLKTKKTQFYQSILLIRKRKKESWNGCFKRSIEFLKL